MSGEIIYVCKCGCEVPKSGVYRSRVNHTTRVLCREHKQPVVSRKKKCVNCDKWFELKHLGPGSSRCSACAKEAAILRKAGYNPSSWKSQKKKNKDWSVHQRGDYCRLLPSCTSRQCSGCKDFVGIFPGVDPEKWLVPGVRM